MSVSTYDTRLPERDDLKLKEILVLVLLMNIRVSAATGLEIEQTDPVQKLETNVLAYSRA